MNLNSWVQAHSTSVIVNSESNRTIAGQHAIARNVTLTDFGSDATEYFFEFKDRVFTIEAYTTRPDLIDQLSHLLDSLKVQ